MNSVAISGPLLRRLLRRILQFHVPDDVLNDVITTKNNQIRLQNKTEEKIKETMHNNYATIYVVHDERLLVKNHMILKLLIKKYKHYIK